MSSPRRFGRAENSARRSRPSVYGVVRDNAACVAIVEAPDGVFLPGGGIESGESPEQALVREAVEECGWAVSVGALLGQAIQYTAEFEKQCSFFAMTLVETVGSPSEPGHRPLWVPDGEACARLSHESHQWAIQEFGTRPAELGPRPRRRIVGFHRDEIGDWVADLECGHAQHVRHDPPWQMRPWVLSEAGRAEKLGVELSCARCVQPG